MRGGVDVNLSYYDILGVSPDASSGEIKAAWRDAAERFEPGSGGSSSQFRLFNEAAEVLLDPERRKAYDEQRGIVPATVGVPAEGAEPTEPTEPRPTRVSEPNEPSEMPRPAPGVSPDPERSRRHRAIPLVALVVLGVLALAAVAGAAYLWNQASQAEAVERARDRAPAAAERAAGAILSYDHRSLEADKEKAARYLSEDYRKEYVKTFDSLVTENATKTKAQVKATVVASSVARATPERADVLLFVNQTTKSTANEGEPSTALNRVMLAMVKDGDTWRVDDITSY